MPHINDNKQFLKIPKNWEGISYEVRNAYIAFLFVKKHSRFGRVACKHLPKKHFGYQLKKLISMGFIKLEGDNYIPLSYEKIWTLIGIKKVNFKGELKFHYRKLRSIDNWSAFKKYTIDDILGYQATRKRAQFRKRNKIIASTPAGRICPLFGSQAAAKMFGYKNRMSGYKYRNRYFDIVNEPKRLSLHYTSDLLPYYRYNCSRVEIVNIYH